MREITPAYGSNNYLLAWRTVFESRCSSILCVWLLAWWTVFESRSSSILCVWKVICVMDKSLANYEINFKLSSCQAYASYYGDGVCILKAFGLRTIHEGWSLLWEYMNCPIINTLPVWGCMSPASCNFSLALQLWSLLSKYPLISRWLSDLERSHLQGALVGMIISACEARKKCYAWPIIVASPC